MNRVDSSENRGLWLLLGLLAMFSLGLFVIPAFVIQPFHHQSERALGLAIAVKQIAPALTVAALVGVLALSVRLWRVVVGAGETGILTVLGVRVGVGVNCPPRYVLRVCHPYVG